MTTPTVKGLRAVIGQKNDLRNDSSALAASGSTGRALGVLGFKTVADDR